MNIPSASGDSPSSKHQVLVFVAHPDDEHLVGAGTIVHCVNAGARVRVVFASRGEAGVDRRRLVASGEALGRVREAEARASCEALGVSEVVFLGLPDGAIARDAAIVELRAGLTSFVPDLVLTFGADGAYGHLDHVVCPQVVAAVFGTLAPRMRPWILHAAYPRGVFESTHRRLRALDVAVVTPSTGLGVRPQDVDLRIDTTRLGEVKLRALACHQSQLKAGDPHSLLPGGVVERLLPEEWYTVAVRGACPLFFPLDEYVR